MQSCMILGLVTVVLFGVAIIWAIRDNRRPPLWGWALGAIYLALMATLFVLDPVDDLGTLWLLLGGAVIAAVLVIGWIVIRRARATRGARRRSPWGMTE